MKPARSLLPLVVLSLFAAGTSASAALALPATGNLVLELTFDGEPLPNMALIKPDGSSAELLTRFGAGIGGGPRSRAFDNIAASDAMGGNKERPGKGGRVSINEGFEALKGARSFTIQGWYRSAPGMLPSNYARLLSTPRVSLLFDNTEGRGLALSVNRGSALSNDGAFRHADRWIFFAVSYDGTGEADNVTFYVGGEKEPVRLVARTSIASGPVGAPNSRDPLILGNTPEGDRPFAGLIDNIRIWADRSGGGAVLSATELEQVRAFDLR
jgi:hypothetical protein